MGNALLTDVVRDAGESKARARGLETKMLDFESSFGYGTKVLDESQGIAEMLVAVTGVEDHVNDIIEPGAIGPGLKSRWPKGIWHHTWEAPICKTLEARELLPGDPDLPKTLRDGSAWPAEAGALKVMGQFNLETQRGREAFSDVKFYGDGQEWSIGYKVKQAHRTKDGIRHIKSMEVPEYSPVLFGAMPLATTLSTKDEAMNGEKSAYVNLPGTLEETLDDVEDAVEAMLPGQGIDLAQASVRVVGTYTDRVIYAVSFYGDQGDTTSADIPDTDTSGEDHYFEAPYTTNENGDIVVGVPHAVDVDATVSEKSDDPLVAALETAGELVSQIKAGRVLSGANKAKVKAAHGALADLLAAAGDDGSKTDDADDETKANAMAKKPHGFKAGGEGGKCATCGTATGNPMHHVKAEADTSDAASKNHAYVAGPFGKCKVCGKAKDDPIHNMTNAKVDPNDAPDGGPDRTTHKFVSGSDGRCSTCDKVQGDPIHLSPFGVPYHGPVDSVASDQHKDDRASVSDIEMLEWEREQAGV